MGNKQEQYFEAGMTAWSVFGIEGIVRKIELHGDYPVCVDFGESSEHYTFDGRIMRGGKIGLLQTRPIITPNVPIIKFEKEELVWVKKDSSCYWDARFFSHENEDGDYCCFRTQEKSGDTYPWNEIRKFNDIPF